MTLSHDDLVDHLKDSADAAEDLREMEREALEREAALHRALALVERALESEAQAEAVREQTGGTAPELVQGMLDQVFRLRAELGAWTRAAWYWWRNYRTLAGRLGLEVPPSPKDPPMEKAPAKKKTPPDVELASIRRIVAVLEPLSSSARARVIRFVNERLEEERREAARSVLDGPISPSPSVGFYPPREG